MFGSSSDEDESGGEEEDDDEHVDVTTALGFMKSLGVDVNTPDECVDELARSNFDEGAKGIAGLAAAAASGVLPASSYVSGYKNAVGGYNASASGGGAGVDLWVPAFRIMLAQANYELKSQASMRAKKNADAGKAVKAALRKAKNDAARHDLSSTWTAGLPRAKDVVLAAEVPAVGLVLFDRDSCELLAGEMSERRGQLTSLSKKGCCKKVNLLSVGCAGLECKGNMVFGFVESGCWALKKMIPCTCSGQGQVSSAAGSTAIPNGALMEVIKPLVAADNSVKSKVLAAALQPYLFRQPGASLMQRLRDAAKLSINGDPLEEQRRLPMFVRALQVLGHSAELKFIYKDEMTARLIQIKRQVNGQYPPKPTSNKGYMAMRESAHKQAREPRSCSSPALI